MSDFSMRNVIYDKQFDEAIDALGPSLKLHDMLRRPEAAMALFPEAGEFILEFLDDDGTRKKLYLLQTSDVMGIDASIFYSFDDDCVRVRGIRFSNI